MSSLFLNSLLIMNIILAGSFSSTLISDHIAANVAESTVSNKKPINVYINSSIYSNISDKIAIYIQDLEAEGYQINVFNCSSGEPGALDILANLKANLTAEYQQKNISGAVFIGDFPYANYFDGSVVFPCDLFLMDLNGLWLDLNVDGFYEGHFNGTGNMYPEIFVSRINPYVLSIQKDACTAALRAYFQRNHEYRTKDASFPRFNNSLMFLDDDWEQWSEDWKADLEILFSNLTMVNNSVCETNATKYSEFISKNYDFAHVFIHSDSFKHYFKVNGSFNPLHELDAFQISSLNDKVLFYNLYCCYACKFNQMDNLGTAYLFNSNYTLGLLGSTRTGGFLLNSYLYNPLKNGSSLGEAFREWWFNDIYEPLLNHGPNDINMKGNVLLGDPTLKIRDPSINQSTASPNDENKTQPTDQPQNPMNLYEFAPFIIGSGALIIVVVSIIIRKKKKVQISP